MVLLTQTKEQNHLHQLIFKGIGAENIDKEKKVYISFYFKTTLFFDQRLVNQGAFGVGESYL
jgi:hypothetical protein